MRSPVRQGCKIMTNAYERPEDAAKRFAQRVLVLEARIKELEAELAKLKCPVPSPRPFTQTP